MRRNRRRVATSANFFETISKCGASFHFPFDKVHASPAGTARSKSEQFVGEGEPFWGGEDSGDERVVDMRRKFPRRWTVTPAGLFGTVLSGASLQPRLGIRGADNLLRVGAGLRSRLANGRRELAVWTIRFVVAGLDPTAESLRRNTRTFGRHMRHCAEANALQDPVLNCVVERVSHQEARKGPAARSDLSLLQCPRYHATSAAVKPLCGMAPLCRF